MNNLKLKTLADALADAEIFTDGDWVESKDQDPSGDVRLVQLADIGDGIYLNKSSRFLTSQKAQQLRCTFLEAGDVLLARMPDPLGRACIFPGDSKRSVTVVDVCVIRTNPKSIFNRYLMHAINSPSVRMDILKLATGTTRQRISRKNLSSIKIPLPSLPEQHRLAEILDQAEFLRVKRSEAIEKVGELIQSVFLEMFGAHLGGDWPLLTVSEIASATPGSIRTGPFGSQLLHSEFVDEGVAVLGIDNAVANEFRWDQRRYITAQKYKELRRYTVHPGDVIITIMGTCGRCAIVPTDIPLAINTKHLCCITLDQEKCLPEYLHSYFLLHPLARDYLSQKAKGAIMEGLNMGIIKAMPIPLPPMALQVMYKEKLESIKALNEHFTRSSSHVGICFSAIQQRAFHGEV